MLSSIKRYKELIIFQKTAVKPNAKVNSSLIASNEGGRN